MSKKVESVFEDTGIVQIDGVAFEKKIQYTQINGKEVEASVKFLDRVICELLQKYYKAATIKFETLATIDTPDFAEVCANILASLENFKESI